MGQVLAPCQGMRATTKAVVVTTPRTFTDASPLDHVGMPSPMTKVVDSAVLEVKEEEIREAEALVGAHSDDARAMVPEETEVEEPAQVEAAVMEKVAVEKEENEESNDLLAEPEVKVPKKIEVEEPVKIEDEGAVTEELAVEMEELEERNEPGSEPEIKDASEETVAKTANAAPMLIIEEHIKEVPFDKSSEEEPKEVADNEELAQDQDKQTAEAETIFVENKTQKFAVLDLCETDYLPIHDASCDNDSCFSKDEHENETRHCPNTNYDNSALELVQTAKFSVFDLKH